MSEKCQKDCKRIAKMSKDRKRMSIGFQKDCEGRRIAKGLKKDVKRIAKEMQKDC